jgi:hypothetical protein
MIAEIRYLNSPEDVLAYVQYDNLESPIHNKAMFEGRIIFTLTPLIGILLVASYFHEILLLIVGAIISVPFWFMYPSVAKKKLDKMYKTLLEEDKTIVSIDEHKLYFNEKNIMEETTLFKTEINWAAIHRIDILQDATYIYRSGVPCFIIPRNAIIEGEYNKFIDLFKETFLKSVVKYKLQRSKGVIRWTRDAKP